MSENGDGLRQRRVPGRTVGAAGGEMPVLYLPMAENPASDLFRTYIGGVEVSFCATRMSAHSKQALCCTLKTAALSPPFGVTLGAVPYWLYTPAKLPRNAAFRGPRMLNELVLRLFGWEIDTPAVLVPKESK